MCLQQFSLGIEELIFHVFIITVVIDKFKHTDVVVLHLGLCCFNTFLEFRREITGLCRYGIAPGDGSLVVVLPLSAHLRLQLVDS